MINNRVSVVVTSYNHAAFLPRRLESLLRQTVRPSEVIVVDDASSDGSAELLKRYEGTEGIRIVALRENAGHAAACNLGASMATGEYLMFAECDDYSEPDQLGTLLAAFEKHPGCGAVYSRSALVDENDTVFGDDFRTAPALFRRLCNADTLIPSSVMARLLLESCVVPNMSAVLLRRKRFNAAGGLDSSYRVCSDWDFWCRLSLHCDFFYVSRPLNNFRRHAASVREVFGIKAQFREIYALLSAAATRLRLGPFQRLRFSANRGFIFAQEALYSSRSAGADCLPALAVMFGPVFAFWFWIGLLRAVICAAVRKVVLRR